MLLNKEQMTQPIKKWDLLETLSKNEINEASLND